MPSNPHLCISHFAKAASAAASLAILFAIPCEAMDGSTWYDNCSKWAYSGKSEVDAAPVEKRVAYRQCQIEAAKVWCELKWEGDATNVRDKLIEQGRTEKEIGDYFYEKLRPYCPLVLPLSSLVRRGPAFLAVKQLEKGGGPGILEQLMPATRMLNRAFEEQFPQCTAARKSIGLVGDSQGCFEAWLKAIDEGL
jgi:hypothetical protein